MRRIKAEIKAETKAKLKTKFLGILIVGGGITRIINYSDAPV